MIKIGIAGCGWIVERAHMRALKKIENVRVESIYDSDLERLCYMKDKFGISNIYTDYEQFLSSDIDGVIIATPNYTHSNYTNKALCSGKHVLCEKPVALSAKEYKKSMEIAAQNNRIFLPAFVNRFRPDIDKLREYLSIQNFGRLCSIKAEWKRANGIPRPGSWITYKAYSGGGVLSDLGPHIFDIGLLALTDKKIKNASINCFESKFDSEPAVWCLGNYIKIYPKDVETEISGIVKIMNGVRLDFSLSWNCDIEGDYTHFEFIYEEGRVYIKTLFGFGINTINKNAHVYIDGKNISEESELPLGPAQTECAFERQAAYFIESILGEQTEYLNSLDGLYVTEMIDILYASI